MDESAQEELDREVGGEYNTLRIYLYMLKVKSSSSRDVQRALGFSSPSLAQHHLEKLQKYDLVEKNYDGSYHVKSRSVGILKLYFRSGKWIVPRTVFFVVIFGLLSVGSLIFVSQDRYFLIIAIVSTIGLVYSIFETARFYKVLPRT